LPYIECARRGDHFGPRTMQARVDGKGGAVDRPLAFDHLALMVDAHQVRHGDLAEVFGKRIHPEGVAVLGGRAP
jgi:hypothetical protein